MFKDIVYIMSLYFGGFDLIDEWSEVNSIEMDIDLQVLVYTCTYIDVTHCIWRSGGRENTSTR